MLDRFKWFAKIAEKLIKAHQNLPPDMLIKTDPDDSRDYISRWWLVKSRHDENNMSLTPLRPATIKNRWFNVYLHKTTGSDTDRALHDHPWINCSVVLRGGYIEVLETRRVWRRTGSIVFRRSVTPHRIVLPRGQIETWSLFVTGPAIREWGYRLPNGWCQWQSFKGHRAVDRAAE